MLQMEKMVNAFLIVQLPVFLDCDSEPLAPSVLLSASIFFVFLTQYYLLCHFIPGLIKINI